MSETQIQRRTHIFTKKKKKQKLNDFSNDVTVRVLRSFFALPISKFGFHFEQFSRYNEISRHTYSLSTGRPRLCRSFVISFRSNEQSITWRSIATPTALGPRPRGFFLIYLAVRELSMHDTRMWNIQNEWNWVFDSFLRYFEASKFKINFTSVDILRKLETRMWTRSKFRETTITHRSWV